MIKKMTIAIAILAIFAASARAITIGPSRFEVSLPAGEVAGADYYVQNETEEAFHVVVEPENWLKEAYFYGDLAIEDWVTFDTYEFDLQPKEIKKLRLTIKVPTDVKGELVAQIFFTSVTGRAEGAEAGGVRARIGAVLYVAVKGTEVVDANVRNITVGREKVNDEEKIKIGVNVRNNGNIHLRPTGTVLVKDSKEQQVAELKLMSGLSVLPRKERTYYAYWNEPEPKEGSYKVTATVDYGKIFDYEKECDLGKKADLETEFIVDTEGKVRLK